MSHYKDILLTVIFTEKCLQIISQIIQSMLFWFENNLVSKIYLYVNE